MPYKHGVYANETATAVAVPTPSESGVAFAIGAAPVQSAASPAAVGVPTLVTSWEEFVEKFGYSDDWDKYPLCEVAYSHFKLFGVQPVIVCNLLNPASHKSAVATADKAVASHQIKLPQEAILSSVVVKASGGQGTAYVKDEDYALFYDTDAGELVIELLSDGSIYDATELSVAYDAVTAASVTASAVVAGMESIELCATSLGVVPDIILAPGYSTAATVAAAMATKAESINGMFKAIALIDMDCSTVTAYNAAITAKLAAAHTESEILCWPMVGLENKKFHLSTQLAGLMAQVDASNDDCPVESPSNKSLRCDSMILANGTEVTLSHAQAVQLNAAGIVTCLNFLGGFVAWGNFTAAYPATKDPKDAEISVKRMFGWANNTVIRTCWSRLDKPMTRRLIDAIIDDLNAWLNGLSGAGYLLGGRIEYQEDENALSDLMQGICRFHMFLTPPSAVQEIEFVMEYDADYVTAAFSA